MLSQVSSNVARRRRGATVAALSAAIAAFNPPDSRAGTSANTSGPVQQGTSDGSSNDALNNPAVTISFSGQTALRGFNTTQGISELVPGTSIVLHNGTSGAPVTYTAPNLPGAYVQLASPDFTSPDAGVGDPTALTQLHSAIRLEWHEQGSVEGLLDLINDQVGYVPAALGGTGPLSNAASRGPSASNPTWINTNKFTAGATINGFTLAGGNYANTYDSGVYDLATGTNKLQGQNRIQFSVGEYKTEGLAVAGTANVFATPGSAGYGLGNPALSPATISGLGFTGAREQFQPSGVVNLSTDKVDPQSTGGARYVAGPWNTAGSDNITSTPIAVTAVGVAANPGTGLSRLNLGDARWLQTTGRLQNGADFNTVSREVNTGQRTVFALNTGIDPSWAVGENDGGDTSGTAAATAQHTVGSSIRFSGKTSGSEAEKTIAQSRLGVGVLSIAEARAAASNSPVRELDIDFNDVADPTTSSGLTDASRFGRISFDSIVSSDPATRWKAVLISQYNTIKAPNTAALAAYQSSHPGLTAAQAWAQVQSFNPQNLADPTASGIKGDVNGDVAAFISNIANSVGTAARGLTPASVNNPADNLYINGFLLPGLLNYTRQYDGGPINPVALSSAALAEQQQVKANYGPLFTAEGTAAANESTVGANGVYASLSNQSLLNGSIPITAKDASGVLLPDGLAGPGGNQLFGNFNQNGVRDFAAVKQAVNAARSLHHADGAASSIYIADGGVRNSTVVPSLTGSPGWANTANTKGDLIVLGDYNSDGRFDGQDLYLLARGASLADSTSTDHLSVSDAVPFADAIRNPNAVLRKNDALDYISAALNNPADADQAFLRRTARAILTGATVPPGATDLGANADGSHNYTFDPNGVNAFNRFDVNRDGKIDLNDARIIDNFYGKDYRNLADQLAATVSTSGTINPSAPQRSISLVDVEQIDGGGRAHPSIAGNGYAISGDDFQDFLKHNPGLVIPGDATLDGKVDVVDLGILATDFGRADTSQWSAGDFNGDGKIDVVDLGILATNFGKGSGLTPAESHAEFVADLQLFPQLEQAYAAAVPEPGTAGVLAALCGGALLLARRGHRRPDVRSRG